MTPKPLPDHSNCVCDPADEVYPRPDCPGQATARDVAGIDREAFEAAVTACYVAICSHKSARMVTAEVIKSLRGSGLLASDERQADGN
jgi:hypothetical protein